MKNKSSGNIWFFLILFVVFGTTGLFPLLLITGAVFAAMYYSVKKSNEKDQINRNVNATRNTFSHGYNERVQGNAHTASDLAKINVYLRKYYRTHARLDLPNNLQLVVRGEKYNTLSNLDVYRNGVRIGTINEFRSQYSSMYDQMFNTLLAMANNSTQYSQPNIVDAEFAAPGTAASSLRTPDVKEEVKQTATQVKTERPVQKYMRQINELNADIPDEEISNGLYEMAALLKQVDTLEQKIPESTEKMKKMYDHYLPYMVQILENFEHIQTLRTDPNYQKNVEQLRSTIHSINQALNTIIPSMSDASFSDLAVDMTTLEALLQKDGLTGGMDQPFYKN